MAENLQQAVERLYDSGASLIEEVAVIEKFGTKTVWNGIVSVFSLHGHPTATRRYAWFYVADEKSGRRKFFAVLHQGPVNSPQNAVRAAIVADAKKRK